MSRTEIQQPASHTLEQIPEFYKEPLKKSVKKGAKEVVADLTADDSIYVPKSARQLQDKLYRISKKNGHSMSKKNNVAGR